MDRCHLAEDIMEQDNPNISNVYPEDEVTDDNEEEQKTEDNLDTSSREHVVNMSPGNKKQRQPGMRNSQPRDTGGTNVKIRPEVQQGRNSRTCDTKTAMPVAGPQEQLRKSARGRAEQIASQRYAAANRIKPPYNLRQRQAR